MKKRKDQSREWRGKVSPPWMQLQDLVVAISVSTVKVIVTVWIHEVWGKLQKHKVQWVNIGSGSM